MEPHTPGEDHPSQNITSSPVHSEGSALSDSDVTNYSSTNSTMKLDLSGGKQSRTSHQEAIATLDFFLNDVSEMTEKAKQEEEKKQSAKEPLQLPPTEAKINVEQNLGPSHVSLSKNWISMPSVVSDDEFGEFHSRLEKSLEDVRSIEYEVFSDEEPELSPHEKKRQVHLRNQANKTNISMSSQGSEVTSPQTYGLTHLNHLCKFLEQFEQLQQQNSELSKRVSNLEFTATKQSPGSETNAGKSSGNGTSSKQSSAVFAVPKDKPKKGKHAKSKVQNPMHINKDKLKGRTKYLALPFFLAAKSVDNLKHGSSQTSDKPKLKVSRQKKTRSYAADDMEIGKTLHTSEEWRNSSVKSPSSKFPEKRFSAFEPDTNRAEDMVGSSEKEVQEQIITPVLVINEEATTSNNDDKTMAPMTKVEESSISVTEASSSMPVPPPRPKSEERNYRNTKKMTEWGSLQQAFPVPQLESNLDILNHLESITSLGKQTAKKASPHHGFKLPGKAKKDKNPVSNMYLPPTDTPGFASTFLAAHAMTNQLSLTLSLSDLELLSPQDPDPVTSGLSGETVSIT